MIYAKSISTSIIIVSFKGLILKFVIFEEVTTRLAALLLPFP